jgi:hypothetical protein
MRHRPADLDTFRESAAREAYRDLGTGCAQDWYDRIKRS